MNTISFACEGFPVPKGSFTPTKNGGFRPAGDPDKINAWRNDVRFAAKLAMQGMPLMTGAIRLSVDFCLPYPHSLIRKYQMGWLPPIKKPDMDKLLRSVCDHLTGIVWVDDSQVCYCTMNKSYAWDDVPGAYVEVTEMDDEWLRSYAGTRSLIKQAIADQAEPEHVPWLWPEP